jgi:hypothetical protein
VEEQVTRDFKEEVAKKENPGEQAKLLAGDGQLLVHRQGREPNVDAVKIGDDVKEKKERDNPDSHFPNRSGLDGFRTGVCFVAHVSLV